MVIVAFGVDSLFPNAGREPKSHHEWRGDRTNQERCRMKQSNPGWMQPATIIALAMLLSPNLGCSDDDKKTDPCNGVTCSDHGTCRLDSDGAPYCKCDTPYVAIGLSCIEDSGGQCGNGAIDPDEECDDGSRNSDSAPDACRTNCTVPHCGDGVADSGEDCDLNDFRSATCQSLGLGNGDLQCTPDCTLDRSGCTCGNGAVDPGEECDYGRDNSDTEPNACRTNCTVAHCGDGVTDLGEECDDGPQNSDSEPDACRTNCITHYCGDGVADSDEDCDDANNNPLDGCDQCAWNDMVLGGGFSGAAPDVGMTDDGSFVVVWSDGTNGLKAQRFDNGAHRVGSVFSVDDSGGGAGSPRAAMAPDHTFVIAWHEMQGTSNVEVFARFYDQNGQSTGIPMLISQPTADREAFPTVDMTSKTIFFAWEADGADSESDVLYRTFGIESGILTQVMWVNDTQGDHTRPDLAIDDSGNARVVWAEWGGGIGTDWDISMKIIPEDTSQRSLVANNGAQEEPAVAVAPDGRTVVVWQDGNITEHSVFGLLLADDGTAIQSAFRIGEDTGTEQLVPDVAIADSGNFVVVWRAQETPNSHLGACLYDANAQPITDDFTVDIDAVDEATRPAVAMDSQGRFVVCWMGSGKARCALYHADGTRAQPGAW